MVIRIPAHLLEPVQYIDRPKGHNFTVYSLRIQFPGLKHSDLHSQVNLTEHLKTSTARDFRINAASLDQALEEQMTSEDESDDDADGTVQDDNQASQRSSSDEVTLATFPHQVWITSNIIGCTLVVYLRFITKSPGNIIRCSKYLARLVQLYMLYGTCLFGIRYFHDKHQPNR